MREGKGLHGDGLCHKYVQTVTLTLKSYHFTKCHVVLRFLVFEVSCFDPNKNSPLSTYVYHASYLSRFWHQIILFKKNRNLVNQIYFFIITKARSNENKNFTEYFNNIVKG